MMVSVRINVKGTYSEKVRSEESIILKAREDLEELHGGRESSEPAGGKVKTKRVESGRYIM